MPHVHSGSMATTTSCRPLVLGLECGTLAAEASWEPLKGTTSGQVGGCFSHGSADCHLSL